MSRIKRTEKTVFKFDELSESAQQRAIERLWDINVDYQWWDCIEEDARNAGINILEFNTDRHHIKGTLTKNFSDSLAAILGDHGKDCETYKTAQSYREQLDVLVCAERLGGLDEDKAFDQQQELAQEYIHDILQDYLSMLRQEYDYLTSIEAIKESIEANEYEFDEEGSLA